MPRLTDLTKLENVLPNDYVYVVDVSDTSKHIDGSSKKSYVSDLFYSYTGSVSSINSVDTVINGVWNATPIESVYVGAHSLSHSVSGSDSIKLDELGLPTDNTNLNANENRNGLLPKLNNSDFYFLNGHGEWKKESKKIPYGTAFLTFDTDEENEEVSILLLSTTGYVAIQWWDNSVVIYGSGDNSNGFYCNKSIPTGINAWSSSSPEKHVYIWPASSSGDASYSGELTGISVDSANYADISLLYNIYHGAVFTNGDMKRIDISSLKNTLVLGMENCNLDYIDLSNLESISQAIFNHNNITNLKIPSNSYMYYLLCYQCGLISISAPGCSFEAGVDIRDNNLSYSALNLFFTDLSSGDATIYVADNPGSLTCDTSIATEKGYTVITS